VPLGLSVLGGPPVLAERSGLMGSR
jgi:hypothetical protein